MIATVNGTITIFKTDKRCRGGKRLCGTYVYRDVEINWFREEVRHVARLYAAQDGFEVIGETNV